MVIHGHERAARYGAPAAFLLAATIAVLLARSGLSSGEDARPPASLPVATTTAPPETTTAGTTTSPDEGDFYEIEPGDTLAVIAERYETTVERLLVLNPDLDPVALRVGDRIRVK